MTAVRRCYTIGRIGPDRAEMTPRVTVHTNPPLPLLGALLRLLTIATGEDLRVFEMAECRQCSGDPDVVLREVEVPQPPLSPPPFTATHN